MTLLQGLKYLTSWLQSAFTGQLHLSINWYQQSDILAQHASDLNLISRISSLDIKPSGSFGSSVW